MTRTPNDRRPTATRHAHGRLVRAALVVLCALALAPAAGAQGLREGKTALEEQRYDDAVAAFRSAVQASPNDVQAHLGLAQALEKKRLWKASYEEFVRAAELDPRLAEPYRGQGSTLLRLDKPAEAEAAFRKATDIDRKFPEAQLGLGEALVRQKKVPEAVAVLEQGVKFGTKTAPLFYEGLGKAEAARDSLHDAEVWLLKAREAAPTSARIQRALGDLYMQRKIPQLAIVSYESAKTSDPSDLDSRMSLGDAYYGAQRYNDALNEYKAVVDASPDYAEGWFKLGHLYLLASQTDPQRVFQSIEALEKGLALEPTNVEATADLAQAYFKKGGVEGRAVADSLLNLIESSGTLSPSAARVKAIIKYENRDYPGSLAAWEPVIAAKRLESVDRFRIADIYRRMAGEAADSMRKNALYDAADSVYQSIGTNDSTTADAKKAQFERARVLYLRKDYARAIPQLQRMIQLDPKSAEAYYYLGLSQRALGDDASGMASLQKAVELDPNQASWWLQLGAGHAKLKALTEARSAFQNAARDSSTTGAIALQQLGYYDLLDKKYETSKDYLERSTKQDPKQVMTWVWLGQARQNSGDRAGAIEAYRKALELKPGEPNATKGLKQLGQ
jgi:superkiller protein 3